MKRLLVTLGIHGKAHRRAESIYLARYESIEQ